MGGWFYPQSTPSYPSVPLVGGLDAKSNNYYLIKYDAIQNFFYEKHARYFKSSPGVAVPCYSYSHSPTAANATLGSLDFSVIDQPIIEYYFNASPNGAATVGAYSVLDLGSAANGCASLADVARSLLAHSHRSGSDLRLDVVAFTDNDVYALRPPLVLRTLTHLQRYHELRMCTRSDLFLSDVCCRTPTGPSTDICPRLAPLQPRHMRRRYTKPPRYVRFRHLPT